jgi:hydrogenase maturation factor
MLDIPCKIKSIDIIQKIKNNGVCSSGNVAVIKLDPEIKTFDFVVINSLFTVPILKER